MTGPHAHGVSVTQKSWAEVCFIVLAFALALGVVRLAAFDSGDETQAVITDIAAPAISNR